MMKDLETPILQPTTEAQKPHRAEATSADKARAFAQFREKSRCHFATQETIKCISAHPGFQQDLDVRAHRGGLFFQARNKIWFCLFWLVGLFWFFWLGVRDGLKPFKDK